MNAQRCILVLHPWELFVNGVRYTFQRDRVTEDPNDRFDVAIVDSQHSMLSQVARVKPTIAVVSAGMPLRQLSPDIRWVVPVSVRSEDLRAAVANVLAGHRESSGMLAVIADLQNRLALLDRVADSLGPSDVMILRALAKGRTLKELSSEMSLAYGSIRNRVSSLLERMGCRNVSELSILAYRLFGG